MYYQLYGYAIFQYSGERFYRFKHKGKYYTGIVDDYGDFIPDR
jgi:hypothetical protein